MIIFCVSKVVARSCERVSLVGEQGHTCSVLIVISEIHWDNTLSFDYNVIAWRISHCWFILTLQL